MTDLAAAARTKLLLLGVGQQEIDGIVASGKPLPRLVIRSPQTGYVVDKKIVEGAAVEAKMTLFEVADLSMVWVEADVYEKDIAFLQAGQPVEATVEAYPNRTFFGRLALIYPQLDKPPAPTAFGLNWTIAPRMRFVPECSPQCESTRRWRASSRTRAWRPRSGGLYPAGSNSQNAASRYEFLCVPERAIIDTGSKKVVYVEREPGLFEGVEVELGLA